MQTVGIRELKAKLSEYLRRVQEGESIAITDRGNTIAHIGPELLYPNLATYDGSGMVRDPGLPDVDVLQKPQRQKAGTTKSYTQLLKETQKAWGYKTPKETLIKALEAHLNQKRRLENPYEPGSFEYGNHDGEEPGHVHESLQTYPPAPRSESRKPGNKRSESYASLLKKAQRGGKHASEKETLTSALKEYLRRQGVERAIAAFGTIEYHPDSVVETQRHRP